MATLPIPFALGEPIWWIGSGHREEWITCPECAGTKVITMLLGNGESYELDCEGCRLPYEPSIGHVVRHIYEHAPEAFTPNRVDISGEEIRYSAAPPSATCWSSAYAKDLFISREECQARCDVLNAEKTKAGMDALVAQLKGNRRKLAWSVHYWRGQIHGLEKQLSMVRARLRACEERERKKEQ
jgi:hypothetical protein